MKTICSSIICAVIVQFCSLNISYAQTSAPGTISLKPAPSKTAIDGDSQEWGDTLSYYSSRDKIHYTLANDKDNLYLVLKTNDQAQEGNILGAGLTFSIDTRGRRRPTYSVTFPAGGTNDAESYVRLDPMTAKLKAQITRFKKIGVDGFKDINDSQLLATNPNGIQVAISFDANNYLVYEEAIPLALFHADAANTEWAFDIKLNALQNASSTDVVPSNTTDLSSGGTKRGKGSAKAASMSTATTAVLSPSIDFGGKFTLAKAQ